jgi:uncharacterized damage-inducible protein DinB
VYIVDHVRLLARYNQWMNEKLYDACGRLPEESLQRNRKAFFASISGTLNHLLVADVLWLKRFHSHSRGFKSLRAMEAMANPVALDQIMAPSLPEWRAMRMRLDEMIVNWSEEMVERDLDAMLEYRSMNGEARENRFGDLVLHLFNHQTHHRGQVTTLLSQAGVDVGATDLLALMSSERLLK